MSWKLKFTPTASEQLDEIERDPPLARQVKKALGFLETNPRHPGLHSHEYSSLEGPGGANVFESYAQNNTPGAYRIFWYYGPDEMPDKQRKKRVPVITVFAITAHP